MSAAIMADEAPAAAAPSAPPATPAVPTDGALPPQPIATAPTEKVAVTSDDASAQIEGSDDYAALEATLDAAIAIEKAEPPVAEAAVAAPTPAPAVAATPPDGVTPPEAQAPAVAEPGSEDDDSKDDALPKNFRFHTEDPKRASFLRILKREPGVDPIDAARRAGYVDTAAQASAAQPNEPVVAPAATIEETLKPMRDELAALEAKQTELNDAFEFGESQKLTKEIVKKMLALERRKSDLEAEASFAEEYSSVYDGAKAEAVTKYPETAVKGTPQFDEIMRERAFLEQTEPGFFDDPNYPIELVKRLETRRPDLFKTGAATPAQPVAATAPATVTPPPNAAAKQPARPVGAIVAGTEGSQTPLTRQALEQAIDNLNPEQLEALADQVGAPVGRGAKRH